MSLIKIHTVVCWYWMKVPTKQVCKKWRLISVSLAHGGELLRIWLKCLCLLTHGLPDWCNLLTMSPIQFFAAMRREMLPI